MSKKEDNPFSFKHFLKKDSSNYQHAGARPKVYVERTNNHCNPSGPVEESVAVETDVYSRNPTELPDFVQDHLVIEQCYLNNHDVSQMVADIDNLPDFALNSVESRPRHRVEKKQPNVEDLRFDMATNPDKRNREQSVNNESLDGENSSSYRRVHRNVQDSPELADPNSFPLDLPFGGPSHVNNFAKSMSSGSNNSPEGINGMRIPKSLPDFLSDGPIRNRVVSQIDNLPSTSSECSDSKLNYEIDLLQRDLEVARRQITDKNRRIQMLEAELASRRAVDYEETAHLEKAMEQVEDNLKRSTRRAVNAESAVTSLKQEVKALMAENQVLRRENSQLWNSSGASCSTSENYENDQKLRRLANDLRDTALSANSLLKQLISGVDNLKLIASTLENIDRIDDRTKDLIQDLDKDNAAGPAL